MNEFSKEVIEIEGVEYTLLLNRAGVMAIEKFTREEKKKVENLQKIVDDVENGGVVQITDDTDPFLGLEDMVESSKQVQKDTYKKIFWIMLRTYQKVTFSEACRLYDVACQDYGNQVDRLIEQIMSDVNEDRITPEEQKNLKNLKALRPTK